MSSISTHVARVSGNLVSSLLLSNVNATNVELLKVQEQIATGRRVSRPSDDASVTATINALRRVLDQTGQQLTNLAQAQANLDTADQSLADVSELLLEAKTIASSQIGISSDSQTRANQAQIISAQITQLLEIANRDLRGVYLFGGQNAGAEPFESFGAGVRYTGSRDDLNADIGLGAGFGVNTNGVDAFGALSARVEGNVDLDPELTLQTRLVDVEGGRGRGVALGTVVVTVDGSPTEVDLTGADTAEDVIDRLNDAIGASNGSVGVSGGGFQLTATAGHLVTIGDLGDGVVAADLGLNTTADASASGTPVSVLGTDLDPHLTRYSTIASLASGVDVAGGLDISNGTLTATIDTSSATTIEDLINVVHAADLGVRMEISDNRRSVRLVNEVSGTELTVGRNAGTTVSDLGLRTFNNTTDLSVLNFGQGVSTVAGDDLNIHLADGSDVLVDLSSAVTVFDVISAINTAAGGSITASLVGVGNGIELVDNTAGGDTFSVTNAGLSSAADDLGIRKSSSTGTITGDDVAKVRVESVFTHLMMLRDGLLNDDERLITEAGGTIEQDIATVSTARARLGVRSQRVSQEVTRIEDQSLANESLLSDVRDTDLNEAITRFTQLQQQLQANLLSGQQLLNLSLLDFLR